MRSVLLLARRYLLHHRIRTGVLVLCIALVFFLPLAVTLLIDHYEDVLVRRARSVPLVIGAKGSRYDLLLSALYFKGRTPDRITALESEVLLDDPLGLPVPVLVEDTAHGHPVIGTTLDYFEQFGLTAAAGTFPLRLGDAVLGAAAAAELGLGPGDRLLTDTRKLYDIAGAYPLLLHVSGVLVEAGTPDDIGVFVGVRTAWVIQGIGHGHQDVVNDVQEGAVIERREDEIVVDASVKQYQEITPENIGSFHFHGDPRERPLTAVLVWPANTKSRTILKARYGVSETAQALVPTDVVEELLGFVFRVKRFFDANVILVSVSTALFLGLIVVLTLRIRKREMETLFKIGCSRSTVFALQSAELLLVTVAGLLLALGLAALTLWYVVATRVVF